MFIANSAYERYRASKTKATKTRTQRRNFPGYLALQVSVLGPETEAHQGVQEADGPARDEVDANQEGHIIHLAHFMTGPDLSAVSMLSTEFRRRHHLVK